MNTEVSAEIGGLPPISQTLASLPFVDVMPALPHEFVTVDMRGLKAALLARAKEQRVSVSVVVRDAVARALPPNAEVASLVASCTTAEVGESSGIVKLSIRLTRSEVRRLDASAGAAGLSRAALISGLIAGVSVLSSGGRQDHLAALIASSAELSTLSRNIHHLTSLLREGNVRPALEYRAMLHTLAGDVCEHLTLAASVLAGLRPRGGGADSVKHSSS